MSGGEEEVRQCTRSRDEKRHRPRKALPDFSTMATAYDVSASSSSLLTNFKILRHRATHVEQEKVAIASEGRNFALGVLACIAPQLQNFKIDFLATVGSSVEGELSGAEFVALTTHYVARAYPHLMQWHFDELSEQQQQQQRQGQRQGSQRQASRVSVLVAGSSPSISTSLTQPRRGSSGAEGPMGRPSSGSVTMSVPHFAPAHRRQRVAASLLERPDASDVPSGSGFDRSLEHMLMSITNSASAAVAATGGLQEGEGTNLGAPPAAPLLSIALAAAPEAPLPPQRESRVSVSGASAADHVAVPFTAVVADASAFSECVWRLFRALDIEDTGAVSWEEFSDFMSDAAVRGPVRPPLEPVNLYRAAPQIDRNGRPVISARYFRPLNAVGILSMDTESVHGTEPKPVLELHEPGDLARKKQSIWFTGTVICVEYLPQHKAVITSCADLYLRVYDAVKTDRREPLLVVAAEDTFCLLRWCTRWEQLYAASTNGSMTTWTISANCRAMHRRLNFKLHNSSITQVLFLPLDGSIVTCSMDPGLTIQEPRRGELVAELVGHRAAICDATYSPDHHFLVTCGFDRELHVWSLHSFGSAKSQGARPILLYDRDEPHRPPICGARCLEGTPQIVSVDHSGLLKVWDVRTYCVLQNIFLQQRGVQSLARDKEFFVMTDYIASARQFVCATRRAMRAVEYTDVHGGVDEDTAEEVPISILFSESSGAMVSVTQTGMQTWELLSGVMSGSYRTRREHAEATAAGIDFNGRRVVIGHRSGIASFYSAMNGQFLGSVSCSAHELIDVAYHRFHGVIIAVDSEGSLFAFADRADSLKHMELETGHHAKFVRISNVHDLCLVFHAGFEVTLFSLRPERAAVPVWLATGTVATEQHRSDELGEVYCATFLGHAPAFCCADSTGFVSILTVPPHLDTFAVVWRWMCVSPWDLSTMVFFDGSDTVGAAHPIDGAGTLQLLYVANASGVVHCLDAGDVLEESGLAHYAAKVRCGAADALSSSTTASSLSHTAVAAAVAAAVSSSGNVARVAASATSTASAARRRSSLAHTARLPVRALEVADLMPRGAVLAVCRGTRIAQLLLVPSLGVLFVNTNERAIRCAPMSLLGPPNRIGFLSLDRCSYSSPVAEEMLRELRDTASATARHEAPREPLLQKVVMYRRPSSSGGDAARAGRAPTNDGSGAGGGVTFMTEVDEAASAIRSRTLKREPSSATVFRALQQSRSSAQLGAVLSARALLTRFRSTRGLSGGAQRGLGSGIAGSASDFAASTIARRVQSLRYHRGRGRDGPPLSLRGAASRAAMQGSPQQASERRGRVNSNSNSSSAADQDGTASPILSFVALHDLSGQQTNRGGSAALASPRNLASLDETINGSSASSASSSSGAASDDGFELIHVHRARASIAATHATTPPPIVQRMAPKPLGRPVAYTPPPIDAPLERANRRFRLRAAPRRPLNAREAQEHARLRSERRFAELRAARTLNEAPRGRPGAPTAAALITPSLVHAYLEFKNAATASPQHPPRDAKGPAVATGARQHEPHEGRGRGEEEKRCLPLHGPSSPGDADTPTRAMAATSGLIPRSQCRRAVDALQRRRRELHLDHLPGSAIATPQRLQHRGRMGPKEQSMDEDEEEAAEEMQLRTQGFVQRALTPQGWVAAAAAATTAPGERARTPVSGGGVNSCGSTRSAAAGRGSTSVLPSLAAPVIRPRCASRGLAAAADSRASTPAVRGRPPPLRTPPLPAATPSFGLATTLSSACGNEC